MRRSRRAFLRMAALAGSTGLAGCHGEEGTPTPGSGNGGGNGKTTTTAATATNGTAPNGTATNATDTPTDTATPEPRKEPWRTYRFDGTNNAVSPVRGATDGVELDWKKSLEGKAIQQPVFDEEGVYVATGEKLYALERADGSVRWVFTADEGEPSTPYVGEKYVYVVTGNKVSKVRKTAGWAAWQFNFSSEFGNLSTIEAKSPVKRAGDTLYVNLVMKKTSGSPTMVNRVVALRMDDGAVRWQYETGRGASKPPTRYAPAPAIDGGALYFTAGHGELTAGLYKLNRKNGKPSWGTLYQARGWYAPTVAEDGNVYLSDEDAYSFKPNGDVRYNRTLKPRPRSWAVTVADGLHLVPSRYFDGIDGRLIAVSARNGRPQWRFSSNSSVYSPAVTGDTIHVGTGAGWLFGLSLADGTEQWRYRLTEASSGAVSTPAVAHDGIYVAGSFGTGNDNSVYALSEV